MAYRYFAAGYLVKDHKVLLVHHKKFDKWTPPGGHVEENETPDQAVIREWKEELGFDIDVLSAHENAFAGDANATPIPMPFHIDLEREGFDVPHLGHFFYISLREANQTATVLKTELNNMGWFAKEDLQELPTFAQVRALATYAIDHYPKQ
ncbi:MAG: NUDIX domain-containing protein [Candidatus Parcubacteria bacterium]|nr:NUDIX domain-containing protein [Candidatus Parcubacteria bacterium]